MAVPAHRSTHGSTDGSTDGSTTRLSRWRRRLLPCLAALVILGLALGVVLRRPAAVGAWNSAAAYDHYLQRYQRAFAELPRPAETLDVRTGYGVVRVYRFDGTGRASAPLLLLPGTSSGTPVWADNLPSLLEVADVYALDLLGEPGLSVQSRPITNHAEQADWLDQTLAQLPPERFHLVGLSIGGWTAANLALRQPRHVASLTLIDPVNVFDAIPAETAVRALPAAVPWLPRAWRDSFTSYTANGAVVEDVPVADMIEAGMKGYTMRLPPPDRLDPQRLAELSLPVLAILAGRSVMHDPAVAIPTAERVLPGRVRVYPGASHAVNGEHPREIAADIAAHVRSR